MKLIKLTSKGFAHAMLGAVVVIGLVAGTGGYVYLHQSSALTPLITSQIGCFSDLGRTWQNNTCTKICDNSVAKPGTLVTSSPYDYCSLTASKISKTICDSKHRLFVYDVCLKEWARQMGADGYTVACNPHTYKYHIASPYDYCATN